MGFVYKARDKRLGRSVVIKVPRFEMLVDRDFRRRFRRELQSLVKLEHRHIVAIQDYDQENKIPFAVMRYLSQGDLHDRRDTNPQALKTWLRDIASALDFVHKKGYVHRDVKPSNILFDDEGYAYLSDFGIAKVLADPKDGHAGITKMGFVIGTSEYMAPELHSSKFDGRIDQYSLAITVYELLAGETPFSGSTYSEIMVAHITEQAAPIPDISTELNNVILRGIEKNPDHRYASCVEFADAVLGAVDSLDSVSSPAEYTVNAPNQEEQSSHGWHASDNVERDLKNEHETVSLSAGDTKKNTAHQDAEDSDRTTEVTYFENGQKQSEVTYKDGNRDGTMITWYENGQKEYEVVYKDGDLNGPWSKWYENGQKAQEKYFKNGSREGPDVGWYESGQKSGEAYLSSGAGYLETAWYENGQKEFEIHFNAAGKEDGLWTEWYENGQKKWEIHFDDGFRNSIAVWKPNGDPCPITKFSNGEGIWADWHLNGQKKSECHLENDKFEGPYPDWYENGQKKRECHFENGKYEGLYTDWYENGQKESEGYFKGGQQDGLWIEWSKDGKKIAEIQYQDGKEIGRKEF